MTASGITIFSRDLQPKNALSAKLVKEEGSLIFFSEAQFLKAFSSILTKEAGRLIV